MTEEEAQLLADWQRHGKSGVARQIRIKAGLSTYEVGRRVGVSYSAPFYWERGQRTPRGAKGLAWAKFMAALTTEVLS